MPAIPYQLRQIIASILRNYRAETLITYDRTHLNFLFTIKGDLLMFQLPEYHPQTVDIN